MKNKTYNILKWIAIIVFPALATLIGVLGKVWGLPDTDSIVTTITAVGTFLGAILGVSSYQYNKKVDEK